LKSDFSFLAFIKKQDQKFLILLAGVLVLAILLIPSSNKKTSDPEPTGDAAQLEELCSQIDGVGECRVMVTYKSGEVYAVAVICRGANIPSVRERLTEMITSIYGIGANRVSIQPMA
jgi:hypothetical protein